MQPAPEAAKESLIRRAYLDLTGLPPSVEAVEAFVADRSPDAYEKVIDRLLASPHYGERWARPWLDLAHDNARANLLARIRWLDRVESRIDGVESAET